MNIIYDSVFNATKDVFKMMLNIDVSKANGQAVFDEESLNISIGVTGDYQGEIIYNFPINTSLSVVNIMSGMEIQNVDEFVTSAVSEIANIISGNFLILLAATDIKCDIMPPKTIENISENEYEINKEIKIFTAAGQVSLDIGLNLAK